MNIRRLIASVALALTVTTAGATVANAAPVKPVKAHTYNSPGSNGCGRLLAVMAASDGAAVFMYATCEHDVFGKSTGPTRVFEAPEPKSRKGCGHLLQVRVTRHSMLYRYVACDRLVRDVAASE